MLLLSLLLFFLILLFLRSKIELKVSESIGWEMGVTFTDEFDEFALAKGVNPTRLPSLY